MLNPRYLSHCRSFAFAAAVASAFVPSTSTRALGADQAVRGGVQGAWGPRYTPRGHHPWPRYPRPFDLTQRILLWNQIAVDASGFDHTPPAPGETRVFGEQLGPGRSARAMAIVHIALFDALASITGGYETFTGLRSSRFASPDAAIAQAAHDALVYAFPSQAAAFDALLAEDLGRLRDGWRKAEGIEAGRRAAAAIVDDRRSDGSDHPEPRLGVDWQTSIDPGHWRQDPMSLGPLALGAHWAEVRTFVLESADQFRVPPPPDMTSPEYAAAYAEAKRLGGVGVPITATDRTPEQTQIGTYWAYDGTPSLCAPPRLYNQITTTIAKQRGTRGVALARLLALLNVSLADAGIAIWESKYHYDFWRPITGIRESDPGTGQTGIGDGNPATGGDPGWTPLGAPASNLSGPNFTPPFPTYPSGHAGFGGALFEVLRRFYRTDRIRFTFTSDELNGETVGNDGHVRPLVPRTFNSLSQAEEENGQSRIYLGIHWSFDKVEGIRQGRQVADYVFARTFRPRWPFLR